MKNCKIAVVHDWLTTFAGAERVLEQILICFPEADLYSVVDFFDSGQREHIQNKVAKTTFIQKLPFARRKYRNYIFLMPFAIEQLDLSSYDLIISDSHAVAKGVITGPDQVHVCYIHSPMRYIWDLQYQYLRESNLKGLKSFVTRYIFYKMRQWDVRSSNGVDQFVANSKFIQRRVWKTYRRESLVIYPPVDIDAFDLCEKKEEYYLAISRLVPYKCVSLIVKSFTKMPKKRLIVIGDGPEMKKIREKASLSENITLLGFQPFSVLKEYMQNAKAIVFAAKEDFGIVPVEAQACGTAVIAYGKGGACETVRGLDEDNPTGVFFEEQEEDSLIEAVNKFEKNSSKILPLFCRENVLQFSKLHFRDKFTEFIDTVL